MFEFKRGISDAFVKRLNAEYKLGGWWAAIANDSSLFVAIRDNYLSVYWSGNSLLELRLVNDELIGKTHYKYLLRPDVKTPYISIKGKRPIIESPGNLFIDDITDVSKLKKAAAPYSGEEKQGVHQIVTSNPNVIDVEIAFGLENEEDKSKSTNRIDFAAIQTGANGPEIVFFEAKCFVNPEIRTSGDAKAPVVKQIQGYKDLLQKHNEQLLNSYKTVINNLRALEGTGIQQRSATLPQIKPAELQINNDVRLVVFGYDSDQDKGAVWQPHLEKLKGINVLRRGNAKGFTRGISSVTTGTGA